MRRLICTDLDRTLIPNGDAPESPAARPFFARLVARPEVVLAYVTGRDLHLVTEAIAEWGLPWPDFVIADVGATVWASVDGCWQRDSAWEGHLAAAWGGRTGDDLADLLADIPGLVPQAPARQGRFKRSYETPGTAEPAAALARLRDRLAAAGVAAQVVWSVDRQQGVGLVDVLPPGAGKLPAIRHLADALGCAAGDVVFAGDSGNDLDVILGDVNAVLVANADPAVRDRVAAEARVRDDIFLAQGGFHGLSGNYAGGILEGVAHFLPDLAAAITEDDHDH